MAEAVLLGDHGGMCGGANIVPRLDDHLYHAARAGDPPRVRELHERLMRISEAIYSVGASGSSCFLGLKCALAHLGLCGEMPVGPYAPFTPRERETVRGRLREVGLLAG